MYSNNIVNFQESTTILNSHTKKGWKLIVWTSYINPNNIVSQFVYHLVSVGVVEYTDYISAEG